MNTAIETFEGVRIFLSLPSTTRLSDVQTFLQRVLRYTVEFQGYLCREYISVAEVGLLIPAKLKKSECGEIVAIEGEHYLTFKCVRGDHFFAGKVCYVLPFPKLGEFACMVRFWGVPSSEQQGSVNTSQTVLRTGDEALTHNSLRAELFFYPVAFPPPIEVWSLSHFPKQLLRAPGTRYTAPTTLWFLGKSISLVLLQPNQALASVKSNRAHNFVVRVNRLETIDSVKADLTPHLKSADTDYLLWAKEEIVDTHRTVDSCISKEGTYWKLVYPEDTVTTVTDLYSSSLTFVFRPSDEVWKIQSEIQRIPYVKWYWISGILFEWTAIARGLTFAECRIPSGSTLTILRDQDFMLPIQSFDRTITHQIGVSQKVTCLRDVKHILSALFQVPIDRCGLHCAGKLINKLMLKEYSIGAGATLYMIAGNYGLSNTNVNVSVDFYDGSAIHVNINIGATVAQLKKAICIEKGLALSEPSRLLFAGKQVDDELRLLNVDIRSSDSFLFASPTDIVITARLSSRAEFAVGVTASATVFDLKRTIQRLSRLPPASMQVRRAGKVLVDGEPLHSCGFRDGDAADVYFSTPLSLVVQPVGSKPLAVECELSDTVKTLKQRITATGAIEIGGQTLTFGSRLLEDEKLLSDYDLCTADCVSLLPPSAFFITVQTALNSVFSLPVTSRYTVKNVKQSLHRQTGLSVDSMDLYYCDELGDRYPVRQLAKVFQKDSVTYQVVERTEQWLVKSF